MIIEIIINEINNKIKYKEVINIDNNKELEVYNIKYK